MPRDDRARPRGRLAGPDEGDAIDDGEAVPAVAGEAQRPAASRVLAGAEHRDRERVARADLDRPAVHDEPDRAAAGASVTGASARPGVEQRLGLEPRRPPPPDDLDLEAGAAGAVRRMRAPPARTRARSTP